MHAMMCRAAATIHPNQRFSGLLGRIEATEIVVICLGTGSHDDGLQAAPFRIGSRTPLDQTYVVSVKRTRCWEDASATADGPKGAASLGWRAIISTQFEAGGSWYSLSFGSPEPATIDFGPDDFAYLDVLAASFANQLQVSQLEGSLRDEEQRSRQHAERLEALRKIVNNPNVHDDELVNAMLEQAATSIRPGQHFNGVLWLVDGDDLVVKALVPASDSNNDFPAVDSHVPLSQTVMGTVISEGRGTRSWDDLQASIQSTELANEQGTRALIVTTFTAGSTTWVLSFASPHRADEPLGLQEHAYVEVVAAFFANHIQQRWQFERIAYQQSHDVLTGLLSRSYFRSQARAAAQSSARYAIVLVNIDAFREINETRGHMIGDAVLVEVGDALRRRAATGEIVGRIGGDVFGIYIASPLSKAAVERRALDFLAVFSTAFSTGDRNGTDFISRTGTLGIAVAPDDGDNIDAVFSHAGTALIRAKQRGPGSVVCYDAGMEREAARSAAR